MIHEAIRIPPIAYRYYQIVAPERKYTKEQAKKQFFQDKNINQKELIKVVNEVHKEILNNIRKLNLKL